MVKALLAMSCYEQVTISAVKGESLPHPLAVIPGSSVLAPAGLCGRGRGRHVCECTLSTPITPCSAVCGVALETL